MSSCSLRKYKLSSNNYFRKSVVSSQVARNYTWKRLTNETESGWSLFQKQTPEKGKNCSFKPFKFARREHNHQMQF